MVRFIEAESKTVFISSWKEGGRMGSYWLTGTEFQDEKNSRDCLHNTVNVLNASKLYIKKWLSQ